ncbi:MAG: cytochrome P460 family protein [Bacteroidetes bacterium]|nr:cytochrome P460 family protein [Bacteroidota bacterium]
MSKLQARNEMVINAPISKIWAVITDINVLHKINPGVIKAVIIALSALVAIILFSCKKKKLNENLYEEAKASGLVLYQNKDSILSPAGSSPHGPFKLKFNSTAASQFGSDGKFPVGGAFTNGSLIVKEVYSGGQLSLYAVMKKDDSKFSADGWLWAEYEPDGKTTYSVGEKGKSCTSCHATNPNRDLIKSFDLY